ncbi:MAG: hypothetical protein AB8E15_01620 [Bdellovibrionales bacterium]
MKNRNLFSIITKRSIHTLLSVSMIFSGFSLNARTKKLPEVNYGKTFKYGMENTGVFNYLTLHPEIPTRGAIYDYANRTEYTETLFGLLVSTADELIRANAKDFVKSNIPDWGYWSMLLGSIAIPHHESKLMHFRKVGPEVQRSRSNGEKFWAPSCLENQNNGLWMDKINPNIISLSNQPNKGQKQALIEDWYSKDQRFFPTCEDLQYTDRRIQLLKPEISLGVMQINVFAHPAFRHPEHLFDLYRHIEYNIGDNLEGFRTIYDFYEYGIKKSSSHIYEDPNQGNKRTIWTSPFNDRSNGRVYGAVQMMFSGRHNIGNERARSAYRWKNPNSEYPAKFRKSLKSILEIDEYEFEYKIDGKRYTPRSTSLDFAKENQKKSSRNTNDIYAGKTPSSIEYHINRSIFHNYMRPDGIEYKALQELIEWVRFMHKDPSDFRNTDYSIPSMKYLKKVFHKYKSLKNAMKEPYEFPMNLSKAPTTGNYVVAKPKVQLYLKRTNTNEKGSYCGYISKSGPDYLLLNGDESTKTRLAFITPEEEILNYEDIVFGNWIKIEMPVLRHFDVKFDKENYYKCLESKELWAFMGTEQNPAMLKVGEQGLNARAKIKKGKKGILLRATYAKEGNRGRLSDTDPAFEVIGFYRSDFQRSYPEWYKIKLQSGKEAWVAADFVEVLEENKGVNE